MDFFIQMQSPVFHLWLLGTTSKTVGFCKILPGAYRIRIANTVDILSSNMQHPFFSSSSWSCLQQSMAHGAIQHLVLFDIIDLLPYLFSLFFLRSFFVLFSFSVSRSLALSHSKTIWIIGWERGELERAPWHAIKVASSTLVCAWIGYAGITSLINRRPACSSSYRFVFVRTPSLRLLHSCAERSVLILPQRPFLGVHFVSAVLLFRAVAT